MNKLTAEKCREQFEKWAVNQCIYALDYSDATKQNYRSMKTKAAWKVWQASRAALEISLPILEQQERGEGEWVDWNGGDCPVDDRTAVEVKTSVQQIYSGVAMQFLWHHDRKESAWDIIAYRIIPERATNQNGEQ